MEETGSGDEDRHKETEQAFDKAVQMRRQGHGLKTERRRAWETLRRERAAPCLLTGHRPNTEKTL